MAEGTVKFFDSEKHFGFINGDDGKSYYFHATQVEQGTHLTDGDRVSFTPAQGERGPKAEKVTKAADKSKAPAESEEVAESSESEETEEPGGEEGEEDEDREPKDEDSEDADQKKIGEDEGSPE